MNNTVEIVTVDATNVDEHGFFCYKSKPKSAGYRQKRDWLEQCFAEGLRIQILYENGRSVGFVEYMPGQAAWRAVHAPGYTVIHCLWVVGRAKNKGYGSRLLERCVEDARQMGQHGVAMVTSSRVWLADKKILLKNGFEAVDQAPPSFELLVKRFDDAPAPTFPTDWDDRARRYGPGLTVIRSAQCPYIEDAVKDVVEIAGEVGIETQVVELQTGQQVRDRAPSAYGVFSLVYDGKLLSYHHLRREKLVELLGK